VETYNRLILNIASTVCILESVESFLGIDISRTYASWAKGNHFRIEKHVKVLLFFISSKSFTLIRETFLLIYLYSTVLDIHIKISNQYV